MTDGARQAIFKAGYDRAYGARPLKRAIQRLVQDTLAVKILDGSVLHGDHVVVKAGKNGLEFVVKGRPAGAAITSSDFVGRKKTEGEIFTLRACLRREMARQEL